MSTRADKAIGDRCGYCLSNEHHRCNGSTLTAPAPCACYALLGPVHHRVAGVVA